MTLADWVRLAAEKGLITASWTLSSVPTAWPMLEGTGPWVPKVSQTSCPEHEGQRRRLVALPAGCPLRASGPRKMDKGTGSAPPPPQPGTSEGQHTRTRWGARRRSPRKALRQRLLPARRSGSNQPVCGEGLGAHAASFTFSGSLLHASPGSISGSQR